MAKISDILRDHRVLSVDAEQTVIEAARLMTEFNIGAVPVLRDGDLIGIFSERDLMRRVVAGGRSPAMTKVSEVMTSKPQTVTADADIDECMQLMREAGFRHLPVMEGTKLLGLISLRDIMMRERKSAGSA
ncbi:MAG: CBS domain-containing protein [Acidobacteriota bacterium]|nr:CBS domain-containing protein [Acidobacteriota bacterium]